MSNLEILRSLEPIMLAEWLISEGEEFETDEDFDGNSYNYSSPCWYTPIGKYPGWYSKKDVRNEILKWFDMRFESND